MEYAGGRHLAGISGIRRAVESSIESDHHGRYRITAVVRRLEAIKNRQRTRRCDLEDFAVAVGAAVFGRAVEIAVEAERESAHRLVPVRPVEAVENGHDACRSHLENQA
jgi:hypothetical protein